uniref:bromodomain-containing protein 7-like n=1 Tax=Styela clava TaxID=7725 RepID=UPI00193A8055|nr:bromodomain-containing protein 7-like [Styela clava]
MGKKHKKHKSERRHDDENEEKPHLKIVLKLGGEGVYDSDYAAGSPASFTGEYTIDNEKSHKKKKKKRRHNSDEHEHTTLKIKKRFKKEYEESLLAEAETRSEPPGSVPPAAPISPDNTSQSSHNTSFSPAPTTTKIIIKKTMAFTDLMRKSLDKLLEHLLRQLERKDPHEIFAWPVNDMIAPGYSDFIQQPMDFSTIRKKIIQHKYNDVNDFRDDFKLMIENCCTYNRPETIFYESAKKLLAAGLKIMSKERLLNMKRSLSFLHDLSKAECALIMGLPIPQEDNVVDVTDMDVEVGTELAIPGEISTKQAKADNSTDESDFDLRAHPDAISFTDADNEETVAPDVLKAAKEAKERLDKMCPKTKMGFLRIDEVGKTTFNFLNPDLPDPESNVVDLGTLTGRLANGLDALPEAKEDKRNRVTPLTYLSYGPFGSFSPTYDSRVANITQEESDLLLSAYGGDTEYLFAKSLHHFVKDSNSDLINMVDDLLDTLTHGAHKRAIESIDNKRKSEEAEKAKQAAVEIGQFSQEVKKEAGNEEPSTCTIQEKLDKAGELVVKLEQKQNERLSEKPPLGQSNLKGPTVEETAIASELQGELTDLIERTQPEQVSNVDGIRKAIGVDMSQVESTS